MWKGSVTTLARVAVLASLAIASAGAQGGTDPALEAKARAIHDRVIALDTHVDIDPRNFTSQHPNYTDRLSTQVNLPKMLEGGLDAVFFSIYVGQGPLTPEGFKSAYDADMEKFAAVHTLAEQLAPDKIEIAYRADDIAKISAKGKKVALMGVETSRTSRSSMSGGRATCRSRTTATARCRTRTPASGTACGCTMGCRR